MRSWLRSSAMTRSLCGEVGVRELPRAVARAVVAAALERVDRALVGAFADVPVARAGARRARRGARGPRHPRTRGTRPGHRRPADVAGAHEHDAEGASSRRGHEFHSCPRRAADSSPAQLVIRGGLSTSPAAGAAATATAARGVWRHARSRRLPDAALRVSTLRRSTSRRCSCSACPSASPMLPAASRGGSPATTDWQTPMPPRAFFALGRSDSPSDVVALAPRPTRCGRRDRGARPARSAASDRGTGPMSDELDIRGGGAIAVDTETLRAAADGFAALAASSRSSPGSSGRRSRRCSRERDGGGMPRTRVQLAARISTAPRMRHATWRTRCARPPRCTRWRSSTPHTLAALCGGRRRDRRARRRAPRTTRRSHRRRGGPGGRQLEYNLMWPCELAGRQGTETSGAAAVARRRRLPRGGAPARRSSATAAALGNGRVERDRPPRRRGRRRPGVAPSSASGRRVAAADRADALAGGRGADPWPAAARPGCGSRSTRCPTAPGSSPSTSPARRLARSDTARAVRHGLHRRAEPGSARRRTTRRSRRCATPAREPGDVVHAFGHSQGATIAGAPGAGGRIRHADAGVVRLADRGRRRRPARSASRCGTPTIRSPRSPAAGTSTPVGRAGQLRRASGVGRSRRRAARPRAAGARRRRPTSQTARHARRVGRPAHGRGAGAVRRARRRGFRRGHRVRRGA